MAKKKAAEPSNVIPLQRQGGSNLTRIKEDLAKEAKNFQQADALSAQATDIRSASREKVRSMGIHPKAFEDAIRYKKMDPDKRDNYDESYAIAREALGLGVQLNFLDDISEANTEGVGTDLPKVPEPMFDDKAEQAAGEQALADGLTETLGTKH